METDNHPSYIADVDMYLTSKGKRWQLFKLFIASMFKKSVFVKFTNAVIKKELSKQ